MSARNSSRKIGEILGLETYYKQNEVKKDTGSYPEIGLSDT
jgi:hypothetical protein